MLMVMMMMIVTTFVIFMGIFISNQEAWYAAMRNIRIPEYA